MRALNSGIIESSAADIVYRENKHVLGVGFSI